MNRYSFSIITCDAIPSMAGLLIERQNIEGKKFSSFWPKCGFESVAYSMIRSIDKDYAWANFENPVINDKL